MHLSSTRLHSDGHSVGLYFCSLSVSGSGFGLVSGCISGSVSVSVCGSVSGSVAGSFVVSFTSKSRNRF